MKRKDRRGTASALVRQRAGHMLRADMRGKICCDVIVVGLGVFRPRDGKSVGDGLCCDPRCGAEQELWGAWLVNGHVVLLGFCHAHADELLFIDERSTARAAAKTIAAARKAAREAGPREP